MKTMLSAFAFAIVLAFVADYGLKQAGFSTEEKGSGSAVRLD